MGSLIYEQQKWDGWEYCLLARDVMRLDRERDRLLLEYVARNGDGARQRAAFRKLGVSEPPPIPADHVSDDLFDEEYLILLEQVRQEDDPQVLEDAAWSAGGWAARFAFCRLTGYRDPAPACDAYSHRTFECGISSAMTPEAVRDFCGRMVERNGPFAAEAAKWLKGQAEDL